ncbi:hypothetical protein QOT17_011865 [Balamuthia mandrillaris]
MWGKDNNIYLRGLVTAPTPDALNWALGFPNMRRQLIETYGGGLRYPPRELLLRLVDADLPDVLEELCGTGAWLAPVTAIASASTAASLGSIGIGGIGAMFAGGSLARTPPSWITQGFSNERPTRTPRGVVRGCFDTVRPACYKIGKWKCWTDVRPAGNAQDSQAPRPPPYRGAVRCPAGQGAGTTRMRQLRLPPWEELPPEQWAMVFREVMHVGSVSKLRDILAFVQVMEKHNGGGEGGYHTQTQGTLLLEWCSIRDVPRRHELGPVVPRFKDRYSLPDKSRLPFSAQHRRPHSPQAAAWLGGCWHDSETKKRRVGLD